MTLALGTLTTGTYRSSAASRTIDTVKTTLPTVINNHDFEGVTTKFGIISFIAQW